MMVQENQFKRKIGNWFAYTALKEHCVYIQIESELTGLQYEAEMTEQQIIKDKNFGFFFEKPVDLFKFLQFYLEAAAISLEGTIMIMVDMPVGKLMKKIEFKIATKAKEVNPYRTLDLKIFKMSQTIESLQHENRQLKQDAKLKEEAILSFRQQISKFTKILQAKDEVINSIFNELKQINDWREKKQKQIQYVVRDKEKFMADPTNPHSNKFIQSGNRFKKIVGGSWDILISKHPFAKDQLKKYHIKQIQSGSNGSLMYGVGTAAIRGINRAQDSKQFIGYYENTGNVYDKGENKKGGPKIKNGDTVTIEVDTINWKIVWYVDGNKVSQAIINGELSSKSIYLAIVVYNQDTQIEFF